MNDITISSIAHLIQLSIGPVFLIAGVGAILNVLANRLARVVDRVRKLEEEFVGSSDLRQRLARSELERLGLRMRLINSAITASTAGVLCVCLVVALMFIGGLTDVSFGRVIAAMFVITMGLITIGLILFLFEIRIAARALRVRHELLETRVEEQRQQD
jgi:Protein of unknown function (DUF2721)